MPVVFGFVVGVGVGACVGDPRAYEGAWGLELWLGLKRLETYTHQGKQLLVVYLLLTSDTL